MDEDLLGGGWSSLPPSLLEVLPEEPFVSWVLDEPLERRRRSRRSLRKEGILPACATEDTGGCDQAAKDRLSNANVRAVEGDGGSGEEASNGVGRYGELDCSESV